MDILRSACIRQPDGVGTRISTLLSNILLSEESRPLFFIKSREDEMGRMRPIEDEKDEWIKRCIANHEFLKGNKFSWTGEYAA